MRKTIKYPALIFLFSIISSDICQPVSITVSGDWSETIDVSDLQSGAGSDLIDTYESASDQVDIDINIGGSGQWQVDVRKTDTNWHSNFQLSVVRTADGQGTGNISGGTSYQEVTDTDQIFFEGSKNRTNIGAQLKLSGVSVQIPPDTYTTTIYYTVSEG